MDWVPYTDISVYVTQSYSCRNERIHLGMRPTYVSHIAFVATCMSFLHVCHWYICMFSLLHVGCISSFLLVAMSHVTHCSVSHVTHSTKWMGYMYVCICDTFQWVMSHTLQNRVCDHTFQCECNVWHIHTYMQEGVMSHIPTRMCDMKMCDIHTAIATHTHIHVAMCLVCCNCSVSRHTYM